MANESAFADQLLTTFPDADDWAGWFERHLDILAENERLQLDGLAA